MEEALTEEQRKEAAKLEKERLKDARRGAIRVMPTFIFHLRMHQLWPEKGTELDPQRRFYMRFLLMATIVSVTIVGQTIYVVQMVREGEGMIVMGDVATLATMIGCMGLVFGFVPNVKYLAALGVDFTEFKETTATPEQIKRMPFYNFLSKCSAYYSIIGMSTHATMGILFKQTCHTNFYDEAKALNASMGIDCGMMYNQYVPFEYNYFPVKQLVTLVQYSSSLMLVTGAQVVSTGPFECIGHINFKFDYLKRELTKIVHSDETAEVKKEQLKAWIAYHNHVVEMAHLLNKAFSQSMLIHISVASTILGICEYVLITSKTVIVLIHVGGWLTLIFPPCYGGFLLMTESTELGEYVYNEVLWYKENISVQKYLQLILIRCQKPLCLYSGPFGEMSLALFLLVLKTSYSFIALLNNVADK